MSQSTPKDLDTLWSSHGCPAQNGDSLGWRGHPRALTLAPPWEGGQVKSLCPWASAPHCAMTPLTGTSVLHPEM